MGLVFSPSLFLFLFPSPTFTVSLDSLAVDSNSSPLAVFAHLSLTTHDATPTWTPVYIIILSPESPRLPRSTPRLCAFV